MHHRSDAHAAELRQRNAHAVARLLGKAHGASKTQHAGMTTTATNATTTTTARAMPDVARCVGRQLELAAAMGTLSPDEHTAMLAKSAALATTTGTRTLHAQDANNNAGGLGDAHKSCLAMQLCIARHGMQLRGGSSSSAHGDTTRATDDNNSRRDGAAACVRTRRGLLERRQARQRAWALRRYEQTLPRRRALDAYVNLTTAQVAASARRPSVHTADALARRYGGRWPLDNAHHQQLLDGEPVMSRIMRGEFYEPHASSNGNNGSNNNSSSNNSRQTTSQRCRVDFVAVNKQRVHAMSERNVRGRAHSCSVVRA